MKLTRLRAISCVLGLIAIIPAPAQALPKTFVSAAGNDANSCDIMAPCASMVRAVSQTSPGGIVSCLDSKDYSQNVTIEASLTIDCAGTSAAGGPFTINGANIAVAIKNLSIFNNTVAAVTFVHGVELTIENVYIANNNGGIFFLPANAGSRLAVYNSLVTNNSWAGVIVQPQSAGVALVDLNAVRLESNAGGVYLDAPSGATVSLVMREAQVSANSNYGFATRPSGGYVLASIDNSTISNNKTVGVYSAGVQSFVFVSRSTISGNNIGWTFNSGGNLISLMNNNVSLNLSVNGSPSGMIRPQ